MNTQPNSWPSDHGEVSYGPTGGTHRPSYDSTSQSRYAGYANGSQPLNNQDQRYLGSDARDEHNHNNGRVSPSLAEGRNGRSRDMNQALPIRERSRTNGASNGVSKQLATNKTSGGSARLCKKCELPLTGQFVRALGGTYHLDCFLCQV